MCGFVGIIDKKKNRDYTSAINLMIDRIKHRGPDEQKVSIDKERGIYLGFCRLAMIDIQGSAQPAYSHNNDVVIMFNGEIYNYIQLRLDLEKQGYAFKTTGEIEVVIKLYELYGVSFVDKLDGMFAICIVDLKQRKTILVRDKFGIKPVYYYENSEMLAFSSELKAIRSVVSEDIEKFSVYLYLNLRFIPAPYTIYKDTFKVKAGEYVIFDDTGKRNCQYSVYNKEYDYHRFSCEEFFQVISDSILSTFKCSEVPLGIFLSGGVDSGIIATILADSLKNQKKAAYCIDYSANMKSDEVRVANEVAEFLNIPYHNVCLQDGVFGYLDKSVLSLDEPFYSTVSISTMGLSERAAQDVKGVLTGDGSDELVYGYKYIRNALSQTNVEDMFDTYFQGVGWLKYISASDLMRDIHFTQADIFNTIFDDCLVTNNPKETLRRVELFKRLPDYHLARVDRLSMANSLEARVPYLRKNYVDYMLSLSANTFIQSEDSKLLLKRGIGNILPTPLRYVYKKPFTAPVKRWIENELKDDIISVFNDYGMIERMGLDRRSVSRVLDQYQGDYADISNVWGIYLLLKWCKTDLKN